MQRTTSILLSITVAATLLAYAPANAQTLIFPFVSQTGEILGRDPATAIQYAFSPPGARSLAMGGAFLGLADDATAAFTNPAGLTNLTLGGSEVAVEFRGHEFTTTHVAGGHYSTQGDPVVLSRVGQDFVEGLQFADAVSETGGISFLSFAYVLPGGMTLAAYRHELANFESAFTDQGAFNDDSNFPGEIFRVLPRRSRVQVEVVNYGASAAYAFDIGGLGKLSLGAGLSYYELDSQSNREAFALCRFVGSTGTEFDCTGEESAASRQPGGFFGPALFDPDHLFVIVDESGDDDDLGLNLGFLWKLGKHGRFSVGGVFRQGPDFETRTNTIARFIFGTELIDLRLGTTPEDTTGSITVPDVWGLGLAYRAAQGRSKVTLDMNRVRYSQTLADLTRSGIDPTDLEFEIDNVTQVHVGLERIISIYESLFVGAARFGVWYEPAHDPIYIGDDPDLQRLLARPGDDEFHYSIGVGLVIKEDYQIDAAVDFSDSITTISFSLVKFL